MFQLSGFYYKSSDPPSRSLRICVGALSNPKTEDFRSVAVPWANFDVELYGLWGLGFRGLGFRVQGSRLRDYDGVWGFVCVFPK